MLEPCALTFTRSVSATRDETMAIDVTEVKCHISPRVVYLVLGVIEALNSVRQVSIRHTWMFIYWQFCRCDWIRARDSLDAFFV